jgi:hypothetical protein
MYFGKSVLWLMTLASLYLTLPKQISISSLIVAIVVLSMVAVTIDEIPEVQE